MFAESTWTRLAYKTVVNAALGALKRTFGDVVRCSSVDRLSRPSHLPNLAGAEDTSLDSRAHPTFLIWQVQKRFRRSIVSDWGANPYTRGSYSYVGVDGSGACCCFCCCFCCC